MWVVFGLLTVLLIAALGYLASLPAEFRVRRSLTVAAPLQRVFTAIVDLRGWPEWSPWLLHEPDARLEFSEQPQQEGGCYSWDGERVGAGRLTHLSIVEGRRVQQEIEFRRPFKSVGEVNWEFEADSETTLVSWEMIGRMPFLFRFMAKHMAPMIERDYDLGLALLNGYLNPAAEHPRLEFAGAETLQDFSYWAVPFHGNLRQLESTRRSGIAALQAAAGGKPGLALTLYRNLDPLASEYRAEIALPIADNTPASNYTRRQFRGGRYFKLVHKGSHRFLPLAWHALFSHCKMLGIKHDRDRPALEIYHDEPVDGADSNTFTTALYLPIRQAASSSES